MSDSSCDLEAARLPNKPLKLTAAGFRCAGGVGRHEHVRITRGRSLAAIR